MKEIIEIRTRQAKSGFSLLGRKQNKLRFAKLI